jgi:hypothetical protein
VGTGGLGPGGLSGVMGDPMGVTVGFRGVVTWGWGLEGFGLTPCDEVREVLGGISDTLRGCGYVGVISWRDSGGDG